MNSSKGSYDPRAALKRLSHIYQAGGAGSADAVARPPDLSACLLQQKLQMVALCIARRASSRRSGATTPTMAAGTCAAPNPRCAPPAAHRMLARCATCSKLLVVDCRTWPACCMQQHWVRQGWPPAVQPSGGSCRPTCRPTGLIL